MPIIARHISAVALAAVLLCGGRVLIDLGWPAPLERVAKPQALSDAVAIDTKPSRSQCRIYFGCPPVFRVAATTSQQ